MENTSRSGGVRESRSGAHAGGQNHLPLQLPVRLRQTTLIRQRCSHRSGGDGRLHQIPTCASTYRERTGVTRRFEYRLSLFRGNNSQFFRHYCTCTKYKFVQAVSSFRNTCRGCKNHREWRCRVSVSSGVELVRVRCFLRVVVMKLDS